MMAARMTAEKRFFSSIPLALSPSFLFFPRFFLSQSISSCEPARAFLYRQRRRYEFPAGVPLAAPVSGVGARGREARQRRLHKSHCSVEMDQAESDHVSRGCAKEASSPPPPSSSRPSSSFSSSSFLYSFLLSAARQNRMCKPGTKYRGWSWMCAMRIHIDHT